MTEMRKGKEAKGRRRGELMTEKRRERRQKVGGGESS